MTKHIPEEEIWSVTDEDRDWGALEWNPMMRCWQLHGKNGVEETLVYLTREQLEGLRDQLDRELNVRRDIE